jgi:putative heme iron utilization protein
MRAISIGFLLALTAVTQAQNDHKVLNSEQTATLCTLLNHPSEYSGKTVRLQAIVASGLEFSVLRDDSCPAKENPTSGKHDVVLATFGKDVHDSKSPLNKKLTNLLKKNHQAEITTVGTFTDPGDYIGHQLCCRYEFSIQRLISVNDVRK